MTFIYTALTWGFLLALIPLAIHLINMMRHRRVKWAAMDFLLQSYKKHRKWIWLKQLLLLLARMAVVALIVAMLARLVTRDQWSNLFGGKTTHHYVLLDDSYSMSDRRGGASAFDTAKQLVARIAARAQARDARQKFTLIRFSQAAAAHDESQAAANGSSTSNEDETERGDNPPSLSLTQVADFNAEPVDAGFELRLEEKRRTFEETQLAARPDAALALVEQLIGQAREEEPVVYVLSDFRAADWSSPTEVKQSLQTLEQAEADVHLISTVKEQRPNLGIVSLEAANETRAAGVPLFVNVRIKNYGPGAARNVPLKVRSVFHDPQQTSQGEPGQARGLAEDLPTELVESIEPGQTVTRRVQVYFPRPGMHVVEAQLPDDSVLTDNTRWSVIDFPAGEPVLVIDPTVDRENAYFLTSVFEPGSQARTGVQPEVQGPAFLRDAAPESLEKYRAIYLLDTPRLDDRAVENLEQYVAGGGGLGVFVGPEVSRSREFYNRQFHNSGEGLLPLPLDRDRFLPAEVENTPDVEVTEHPIFEALLGERNLLFRTVRITQYLAPPEGWAPDPDSTVQVIARLRNGAPLAVEKQFGEGRVVTFLTTLSPEWNNWSREPSFVVTLLKLQSHLASARRAEPQHLVGSPLELNLEAEKYRQDLTFVAPGAQADTPVIIERQAQRPGPDSPLLEARLGDRPTPEGGETRRGGVYEAWPLTVEGQPEARRYAVNVAAEEGDLTLIESPALLAALDPLEPEFYYYDDPNIGPAEQAGYDHSMLLMTLLICLLLGEQALAYSASYHPQPIQGGAR